MTVFNNYPFQWLAQDLRDSLLDRGTEVDVGEWQSKDISDQKLMTTRELSHLTIILPIPHTPATLSRQVEPNLPWAEEHFLERVSGQPLNPPPSHVNWPWARHNETSQTVVKPEIDQRKWAYLAAFIDADGSIGLKHHNGKGVFYPRVVITQKDHDSLKEIVSWFPGVGTTRLAPRKTQFGDTNPLMWRISAKNQLRWLLAGVLPYLVLKKPLAKQALEVLGAATDRHNTQPFGTQEARFSHTYPERMWSSDLHGRRWRYGDLLDVVNLLKRTPLTRQAILPIWHPEDTGNVMRERVPCSIMYHFLIRGGVVDCEYYIRSCDFVRHFRDDVYLTCRLVQWVAEQVDPDLTPGTLHMRVGSLHIFKGDVWKLEQERQADSVPEHPQERQGS